MTSALQQTRQRQAHLDKQQLDGIQAAIRGHVCLKGGYDEARTIAEFGIVAPVGRRGVEELLKTHCQ
jgi:hypothetical protein